MNRTARLLLNYGRAVMDPTADTDIVDLQPHEIAPSEFAVDREVEQGEVAGAALHLESELDRPHVLSGRGSLRSTLIAASWRRNSAAPLEWRVSSLPRVPRSLLTGPTAATQPYRQELVFMPHSCPCLQARRSGVQIFPSEASAGRSKKAPRLVVLRLLRSWPLLLLISDRRARAAD